VSNVTPGQLGNLQRFSRPPSWIKGVGHRKREEEEGRKIGKGGRMKGGVGEREGRSREGRTAKLR